MLPFGSERVAIEESVTGQAQSVECTVVQAPFQYIHVLRLSGEGVHALVPEDHAHGCAGFTVRFLVRQVIVLVEPFIAACRADASCDVHVPEHDILPYGPHGPDVVGIPCRCGNVGGSRVEVHGAHRVSGDLFLFFDGQHILRIRGVLPVCPCISFRMSFAPFRQQPFGHIQILPIAGGLEQFHQGKL